MLRSGERDLSVGIVDGENPRPDPDGSYARDGAPALAVGLGNGGPEMSDWRDPDESVLYMSAMRERGLATVCIIATRWHRSRADSAGRTHSRFPRALARNGLIFAGRRRIPAFSGSKPLELSLAPVSMRATIR